MIEFTVIVCILMLVVGWYTVGDFWFGEDQRNDVGTPIYIHFGIGFTLLICAGTWIVIFGILKPYLNL